MATYRTLDTSSLDRPGPRSSFPLTSNIAAAISSTQSRAIAARSFWRGPHPFPPSRGGYRRKPPADEHLMSSVGTALIDRKKQTP